MADTIVPLHFWDDTPLWRAFILYSLFVFDDVLDPNKLRNSLEAVIQLKGWKKLGARLRQNANGNLEYHIPENFTAERPALMYSHISYDTEAKDHPIASQFPEPSTRPAVVGDPDEFQDLFLPKDGPIKLADYLKKDIPQLGLHIVSFTDKTLVSLHFPHTLMDALGTRALLDAWTLSLQGRENEIISVYGTDTDLLAGLGKHQTEPHKLVDKRMSLFSLVLHGLSNLKNFLSPRENRMVCIPHAFILRLHSTAISELKTSGSEDPFLTEGDILCAWWTKLAISHLPSNSNPKRSIVLNNAYSLRKPLSDSLLPKDSAYISCAVGFTPVLLSHREIVDKPLSHVANKIRLAINELGTRDQAEAFASLWRNSYGKLPPFFGDWGMHMITYSNWSKATCLETDFSVAVVKSGNGCGRPVYIQNNQFGLILPKAKAFLIVGKDNEGNYWVSGYLKKGHWEKIEKQLAKLE